MLPSKEELKEVFYDTQRFYRDNPTLAAAVARVRTGTTLYKEDDFPEIPSLGTRAGRIEVVRTKTFETAINLHKAFPDKRITVLNFASARNPGGGVLNGSRAQEESLCRCSTLYPALDRKWLKADYYEVNRRAGDCRNTDVCIYSPGVVICKTDDDIPARMEEKDFVTVDVISCAAPDLRGELLNWRNPKTGKLIRMEADRLRELHINRAKHILHVAAGRKTEILILGAFGCGAFQNDPDIVAEAYQEALKGYQKMFDRIVFSIYCNDRKTENYTAFEHVFGMEIGTGFIK